MNPRYRRVADHLKALIDQGREIEARERRSPNAPNISNFDAVASWHVRVQNVIRTIFGEASAHNQALANIGTINWLSEILKIVGILDGALQDLEGGFLIGQEHLVASEVFDNVLEEAKHLVRSGHKDPAAVLVRIVVENTLRRLCKEESLPDTTKAAAMNESLRDCDRFTKPQWRQVQVWLDIGNEAAHGRFDQYTKEVVVKMIDEVATFLAQQLA